MYVRQVAGCISRTATAPMDRLKMLLQVDSDPAKRRFKGVWHGMQMIYAEGASAKKYEGDPWGRRLAGVTSYFRGNGTNCIKARPPSPAP